MLRVHVLGGLRVDGLADARLGSRKGRRLLAALAVAAPGAVSIDTLVELVWPDTAPARPVDQVGVLVSRLRRALGPDRIVRHDAGYSLACDWTDLQELSARAREAAAALDAGRSSAARTAAEAALALGHPLVLPEEDGAWVEAARVRALADVAAARRVAVDAAVTAGDLRAAVVHAEALLADDPFDEPVTRALMQAQFGTGRPAAALATYARLRSRLAEDLGVSPSEEVEELHTAILTGQAPIGPRTRSTVDGVVGRDHELAELDAQLAQLGRARVVVVEGEPGMGKTSLLDAWMPRIDPSTAFVLRGRGDPLGRDLPLQPVADALHDAVRARPQVLDVLPADDRAQLSASLGIGGEADGTRVTGSVSAAAGTARLYTVIDRLLVALGEGRPVVVVIDDLHHAGPSTLSWVAFTRRRAERVLVVAARRPGTAPIEGATVVRLGPLDQQAVEAIVGEDRAPELLARSGGHPLLLRALADAAPGSLPRDLHDAVDRQLAALGAAAEMLRRAAILGPDIDLDLIAGVEAIPAADALGHLEAAVDVGLLVEATDGLRFRHDLVRMTLEAQVTSARQQLVHRQAASCLATRVRADWAAVAIHAHAGGDDALAADAYRRAAELATRRFDPGAAEAYLDEAIALEPTAGALVARARVRIARQELDGASTDTAEAIARGGGAPALEVAAWTAYYRRRYDEALARADEALAAAPDPVVELGAVAVGARVRHGAGNLAGALDLLESRGEGPPEVRGVADVWHALALVHAGDSGRALRLADRALAVGDGLAQPFAPLHGRFARVMALGHLGRPAQALAACDDLEAAMVRLGEQATRFDGPAANVRGWLLRNLGRHAEATEANERGLEASRGDGARAAMAEALWVAMLDLADGALLTGALDEAADLLDRCRPIETWDGTMAWHQRHRFELLRARLDLATGRPVEAAERSAAVAADAAGRGSLRYEVRARAQLAAADPAVDPAAVVEVLDRVAGLEAWRHTAEIAAARRDDGLRHRSERQLVALLAAAREEDGASLSAMADTLLGR